MVGKSEIKIVNDSQLVESREDADWYNWRIHLEAPPSVLKEAKRVVYRLHPTFPDPVRIVGDPKSKLALKSAGWGEFKVQVHVQLKDGTEIPMTHQLKLGKSAPSQRPVTTR